MISFCESRHIEIPEWENILEKLCLKEKIINSKRIVIKPNLAAGTKADPVRHICTDMVFLKNIVELCRAVNPSAEILICEGDSTGDGFAYLKFKHFELPEIVDPSGDKGVKVLDMSRDQLRQLDDKRFLYFSHVENLWLSRTFLDADFKISLSNLKTHSVTLYTGVCKNLFGCLPASVKSVYHPYIHQVVHDLTLAIQPDLNVIDAFYAMEENGPVAGKDIDGGVRIFGNEAFEADCYGAALIGIDIKEVKYLKYLQKNCSQINLDKELINKYGFEADYPQKCLSINNSIGLWIQRRGYGIANTGDRIHIAKTPFRFIVAVFRPLLIKVFGIKKLKNIKRNIEGD